MKYFAVLAMALGMPATMQTLPVAAQEPAFYDSLCPNANAAVEHYTTVVKLHTTLVIDAVSAANAASSAYDACGDRYRSAGDAEHMHYASLGAARYHYAAGRLLRFASLYDDARTAFQAALDDVVDTIAWGLPSAPSAYKSAALEIRDATNSEIAKIPADATPQPAPSPSPT